MLIGGKTVPLETSIKEAKAAGYVLGDEELVKRQFEGLVKCMRDGTDHTAASFTVDPSAVSEKPYGLRIGESFWGS